MVPSLGTFQVASSLDANVASSIAQIWTVSRSLHAKTNGAALRKLGMSRAKGTKALAHLESEAVESRLNTKLSIVDNQLLRKTKIFKLCKVFTRNENRSVEPASHPPANMNYIIAGHGNLTVTKSVDCRCRARISLPGYAGC